MSVSSVGRVALVTGANKGLGYFVASQLAGSDPHLTVLVGSRDAARGEEAVKAIKLPNVRPITIDVSSKSSIADAFEEVKKTYGGLDLLCNNAGIFIRGRDANADHAAIDETIAVNYRGALDMCHTFLPIIRQNGRSE